MSQEKQTVYTVQSVDKAFELLEILSEDVQNPALPYLAERVGLSRNKTFRLLSTLCEKGLVERDDTTCRYHLGVHSVALAQKFLKNASVVTYAHPIMEDLARKHDEAVYMTVIKDDEVVFLDMVDSEQQIKATSLVGRTFPIFSNAAGKVMKAVDSMDVLEKWFKQPGRRKSAPDMESLATELNEIRSKGVAVDSGGLGDGVISVAVVVRDYAGKVVGAITMLGPSFRMLAERLENEIIPSLLEGAELLSEKFGYARAHA
jgi:DNA-binding IclR family transcriptional regulator